MPKHAAGRVRQQTPTQASAQEPGRAEGRPKRSAVREVVEWVVVLALAAALAFSINTWVGGLVTVTGDSMQPTLQNTERVLIGKVEYYFSKPKRGDIVIVKYPNMEEDIIKRVIATPGERVAVKNRSVYINGKKLIEPYLSEPIYANYDETTVPDGTIFVMGDNRNNSHDSRDADVGPVPLNQVLGRGYVRVWPLDKFGKLTDYKGTIEK